MTDGFVTEFGRYVATRSDCPPDYAPHAALAALAVALGNDVWTDGWSRPIYPNIWAILLGRSGMGKSVPLDISSRLLQKAGFAGRLLPVSFSQEGITQVIKEQRVGAFVIQEFGAFLGMIGRDYNAGLREFLTEIYDVPDQVKRVLVKGSVTLEKPTISILGASTPDWFAERFKTADLRGGFLARFVFCVSHDPGPPVADPGPIDDGAETVLADHLRQAGMIAGRMDATKVRRRFADWDQEARARLRAGCPPEFAGLRSRAGLLVKKATMLFHVSRDPYTTTLEPSDLDYAIAYVEHAQGMAERFLTEGVAQNSDDLIRMRVLELCDRAGGRVLHSDALKNSHVDAGVFARAIRTLLESGQLVIARNAAGERGKFYARGLAQNSHQHSQDFAGFASVRTSPLSINGIVPDQIAIPP